MGTKVLIISPEPQNANLKGMRTVGLVVNTQLTANSYLMRVLIALDMLGAAIFGFPNDVTISSESGLYKTQAVWAKVLYAILDWIQPGHCESAISHDVLRAQDAEIDLNISVHDKLALSINDKIYMSIPDKVTISINEKV